MSCQGSEGASRELLGSPWEAPRDFQRISTGLDSHTPKGSADAGSGPLITKMVSAAGSLLSSLS